MEKDFSLATLKKDYEKIRQKYSLPGFKDLNEDFDIERITEKETETLLREVRKAIMDKSVAYLRFLELFINPQNAPMFLFAVIKGLDAIDKKILENIYSQLGEFEIEVIELDTIYSEKKEAEFIKKTFKEWQDIKQDMIKLSDSMKKIWKQKSHQGGKSYLG